MNIEQFIKEKQNYLNFAAIEKDCSISNGTIYHHLRGVKLSEKNSIKLIDFFKDWNIEQPKEVKPVKQQTKPTKHSGACVNIKDYKLLLSGKYQNKSGDKVSLKKIGDKYYLDE